MMGNQKPASRFWILLKFFDIILDQKLLMFMKFFCIVQRID